MNGRVDRLVRDGDKGLTPSPAAILKDSLKTMRVVDGESCICIIEPSDLMMTSFINYPSLNASTSKVYEPVLKAFREMTDVQHGGSSTTQA